MSQKNDQDLNEDYQENKWQPIQKRIWTKQNSSILLVGMRTDAITMKINIEIFENRATVWSICID